MNTKLEQRSGDFADVNHNQGEARATKGKIPWNYEEADIKPNSQVAKIHPRGRTERVKAFILS